MLQKVLINLGLTIELIPRYVTTDIGFKIRRVSQAYVITLVYGITLVLKDYVIIEVKITRVPIRLITQIIKRVSSSFTLLLGKRQIRVVSLIEDYGKQITYILDRHSRSQVIPRTNKEVTPSDPLEELLGLKGEDNELEKTL